MTCSSRRRDTRRSSAVTSGRGRVAGIVTIIALVAAAGRLVPAAQERAPAATTDPFAHYPPFEWAARGMAHERSLVMQRAIRLLAGSPGSTEAADAFLAAGDPLFGGSRWGRDGLATVRTAIDRDPASAARLLQQLLRAPLLTDNTEAIDGILAAARLSVTRLPKAQAAELAFAALQLELGRSRVDPAGRAARLRSFADEYNGTWPATLAALDIAEADVLVGRGDRSARVATLESFARKHAGTCAAAAALRRLASLLGSSSRRRGEDPTADFLRAIDIASRLDSPPYRACPRDTAPDPESESVRLVAALYAYEPSYAPGNVARLLDAYGAFVEARFNQEIRDFNSGLGYIIASRMGDLFEAAGDRAGGLDRYLAALEANRRHVDQARFLRAAIQIPDPWRDRPKAAAPVGFPEAPAAALRLLSAQAGEPVAGRSLATLAWLYQVEGRPAEARELYRSFLDRYPGSGFAWLAAVRAGQCAEALGDTRDAVALYRSAARHGPAMPLAPVFGHAYAARAFESLGEASAARDEYGSALSAWDIRYGRSKSLPEPRRRNPDAQPSMSRQEDASSLYRERILQRVATLARTTAAPGGSIVERARRLIDGGRPEEGIRALDDFAARFPGSSNIGEASYLSHKGRLFHALGQLADPTGAGRAGGEAALDALAAEPYDFPVVAAAMARAVLLHQRGARDEADQRMRAALERWRTEQAFEEPDGEVARDVAEIRRVVFQPLGGPVFGDQRWNAFSWPPSMPPYLVANTDLTLGFADDRREPFSLAQRYPAFDNLLGLTEEQVRMLEKVIGSTGGAAAREGRVFVEKGVMETPVVPVGRSVDVIQFLARYFHARPGHWGGWEVLTYPVITEITFTTDARSAAVASVTIGYSGCRVLLEKQGGRWVVVGTTHHWVT